MAYWSRPPIALAYCRIQDAGGLDSPPAGRIVEAERPAGVLGARPRHPVPFQAVGEW